MKDLIKKIMVITSMWNLLQKGLINGLSPVVDHDMHIKRRGYSFQEMAQSNQYNSDVYNTCISHWAVALQVTGNRGMCIAGAFSQLISYLSLTPPCLDAEAVTVGRACPSMWRDYARLGIIGLCCGTAFVFYLSLFGLAFSLPFPPLLKSNYSCKIL